jgi:hypothetical protein
MSGCGWLCGGCAHRHRCRLGGLVLGVASWIFARTRKAVVMAFADRRYRDARTRVLQKLFEPAHGTNHALALLLLLFAFPDHAGALSAFAAVRIAAHAVAARPRPANRKAPVLGAEGWELLNRGRSGAET